MAKDTRLRFRRWSRIGSGVPYDVIELRQGDSADLPKQGYATIGSRSMIMAGSALSNTCEIVIEKGRKAASHYLEAAETDIEFPEAPSG